MNLDQKKHLHSALVTLRWSKPRVQALAEKGKVLTTIGGEHRLAISYGVCEYMVGVLAETTPEGDNQTWEHKAISKWCKSHGFSMYPVESGGAMGRIAAYHSCGGPNWFWGTTTYGENRWRHVEALIVLLHGELYN